MSRQEVIAPGAQGGYDPYRDESSSRRTVPDPYGRQDGGSTPGGAVFDGAQFGSPVYQPVLPYPPPKPVLDKRGRVELVPVTKYNRHTHRWFSWDGTHNPQSWFQFLLPIAAVVGVVLGVRMGQDSPPP